MVLFILISNKMANAFPARNTETKMNGGVSNGPAQDWQLGKKVLECNKYMFENGIECDVTFSFPASDRTMKCMEVQLLPAHKYVLISRSPVFYAMLAGPARDQSGLVTIEDVDMMSFKEMLRSVQLNMGKAITYCDVPGRWVP